MEDLELDNNHNDLDTYDIFNNAIINTGKANDINNILAKITEEIRKITKFDRVLIYRFENDGSGFPGSNAFC